MNTPPLHETTNMPAPRRRAIPMDHVDPLLQIREQFTRWIDPEIEKSRDNRNQCLTNDRHDMADTFKAETQALEDSRYVILKMIDEELREIVRQNKDIE